MTENIPLGFDGISGDEGTGSPTDFTVQFTPSAGAEHPEETPPPKQGAGQLEEVGLLEEGRKESVSPEERRLKEQTVMFEDGVTSIDFILTYVDKVEKKGKEDTEERKDKREAKRKTFIKNCEEAGLKFEHQDCAESPDRKTHYLKVHGTHDALLRGAEDMLIRMPIRENNLKVSSIRERVFDSIKLKDPFEPVVPRHLRSTSYFTAPFSYEKRRNFLGWDDEKNFFTSGQRSAIVHFILLNQRYGEEDDQVGLLRLLANKSFSSGYPLHESSEKLLPDQTDADLTDRSFLYKNWSYWTNWYKRQPLNVIRRYFGEKIGIYFTWLGFYTSWLLPVSLIGIIIFLYGLSRIPNPLSDDICNEDNRYDFYMCPRCDISCDFWYLTDSCSFSYLALIFDNEGTVLFSIIMSIWAILFLEFWKRRQYTLQYDWDVLGFEESEQRARPEFEQKIKTYIRSCKTPEAKKKFIIHNPVLDKPEYIQPSYWFIPKVIGTFSILITMVLIVLAIVFSVILYRLAVAGAIYRVVSGLPLLGPSVGDIVVAVTGALIQLVAIIVMNKLYEFLAFKLTNWELHRTQTDYDDAFISKMYIFQFFNFYTSLFYIAFIKGNATGNPGDYNRIGTLRVDECATYGCLLELTIQLFIIMVGKQALNNGQELAIPYLKRIINCFKHKKEDETDIYARWEKDFDLIPLSQHGLFFEYLELVIQYGFVTIFVAAFPLAPLFALLNNWIEIRLDAHKFVVVFRRAVPQRAGDIGTWYSILAIVSNISVVTNALLIAFTAQFIPLQTYLRGGYRAPDLDNRLSGYINWSLSTFTVNKLLDGRTFPAFSAHELELYGSDGEIITRTLNGGDEESDVLYLPYIDFSCLVDMQPGLQDMLVNISTENSSIPSNIEGETIYRTMREQEYKATFVDSDDPSTRDLVLDVDSSSDSPAGFNSAGPCFLGNQTCRFRSLVEDGGIENAGTDDMEFISVQGVRYWNLQAARLAFIVIFENFIFLVTAVLAYLVPDVPQSVKNEIQREKLLAYEAIHARQEQGKTIVEVAGDDEPEDAALNV